jgi:hypothetical protein
MNENDTQEAANDVLLLNVYLVIFLRLGRGKKFAVTRDWITRQQLKRVESACDHFRIKRNKAIKSSVAPPGKKKGAPFKGVRDSRQTDAHHSHR